ncbi:MAG: methylated-DNA--[protein]-cysteine S-methyltransferase [Actinobacteria bacterium]|nr:methylated-DNA--[protein]-cysteine S-methyltransferase [Actinomycetota bacterium]
MTTIDVPDPGADRLTDLRRGLAERADAAGLLDLAYRTVDAPIGSCLVVVGPEGLLRLAFEVEDHASVLEDLAEVVSPRILADRRRTDQVARELDEYFAGARRDFEVPVDLGLSRGFRRTVLDELRNVGYGSTISYAALAESAGNPKAVRVVGSACASNPVPIVVPCHRVVRSDGTTGAYRGGSEAKVALLAMEADASR